MLGSPFSANQNCYTITNFVGTIGIFEFPGYEDADENEKPTDHSVHRLSAPPHTNVFFFLRKKVSFAISHKKKKNSVSEFFKLKQAK